MHQNQSGDQYSGEPDIFADLSTKKVYIETYGCRYNFGDTANLIEILKKKGSTVVATPEEADAVIINTCTVVGPTEQRMLRRFVALRDKPLFVTGCMPMVQRDAILAVCSPIIITPDQIRNAYRLVQTVSPTDTGIAQIASGCLGCCTYCITKQARGPLVSFPKDEIRKKTEAFIKSGVYEIQLTAQDVSAWGMDIESSLPDLLSDLCTISGNYRIRLGMMNPATVRIILKDLIEVFSNEKIFQFVHLPVQSGSNSVLENMGRGYTAQESEDIVTAFRQRYPEVTIATDVIVGFPGETERDFTQSLELIGKIKPAKVNVTRYSARPFTGPFDQKDFPDSVKKDRSRILNAYAEDLYTTANRPYIGTTVSCVVTEKIREGSVMARTQNYLGVVIPQNLPVGTVLNVRIKKDRKYFFLGDPVFAP